MKKKSIIMLILIGISILFLTLSITLAWFDLTETSGPITFNTGSVKADINFYQGIDSNENGIIDENEYHKFSNSKLDFNNIIPGQSYFFRLKVKNIGSIDGNLNIEIGDIVTTDIDVLKCFELIYHLKDETINLTLDRCKDGYRLLDNELLNKDKIYTLDFSIKVKTGLDNKYDSFSISEIFVRLEQVH